MKQNLKEELLILTDELEKLAIKGKTDFGNDVHIYVSQINFETIYSYLETSTLQFSPMSLAYFFPLYVLFTCLFCQIRK